MKRTLFLFTTILFVSSLALAIIPINEDCLTIKGSVYAGKERLHNVSVTLYNGNTPICRIDLGEKPHFKFQLKKDKIYTILIEKDGYENKLITVDTNFEKELKKRLMYEFIAKISLQEKMPRSDSYYLDFPVAVIKYDERKNVFSYNKDYTEFIKKAVRDELIPAMMYAEIN